jgi:hypothetical protein
MRIIPRLAKEVWRRRLRAVHESEPTANHTMLREHGIELRVKGFDLRAGVSRHAPDHQT